MGYQNTAETFNSAAERNSVDVLYGEVQQLMDSGSWREAIGGYKMLLAIYPDYALAHNDLGVLYYKEGEKDNALMHYEAACRLDPENAVYQKNLADFYCVERGDMEGALKRYLKVLEANPTDVETLVTLGDICVSLGKGEDARVFYNRVLELEPWNMDAQQKLDGIETGQRSEIIDQRSEVRGPRTEDGEEQVPDGLMNGWTDDLRGRSTQNGSTDEAYAHSQDLLKQGHQAEAIRTLEDLVEARPDYAIGQNDLGVLYYREGDKQKALTHYEQATRLEPENPIFQKNLADFYCVEMGEYEKALKIYVRVLEDNPTDIETLTTLGDICISLGKKADARVFYDRVLDLEPWNMDTQEKLDGLLATC